MAALALVDGDGPRVITDLDEQRLRANAARDLYAAMTELHLPVGDAVAKVALAWYQAGIGLGWPEQTALQAGRFVVAYAAEGASHVLADMRRAQMGVAR